MCSFVNIRMLLVLAFSLLSSSFLNSQVMNEKFDLHPPLKIPMIFAGNFGELRSTHFHSGVDFKTNGREGYRVYSSERGYVSRIVVSPRGYGNAVYITHPNGLVTVYGHLKNFNSKIAKYVRNVQYRKENWEIDEFVKSGVISVERGEKIGLSGNTGASVGPHLHYEIRDEKTEDIINPFIFFDVKDNIRPKIFDLYVYSINNRLRFYDAEVSKYKVYNKSGKCWLSKDTLELNGELGFGLKVKDYVNGSWNFFGLYSIKTFVNDSLVSFYKMDRFSFANTNEINILKDMKMDVFDGDKIYKTWLPVNPKLNVVKYIKNNGLILLNGKKSFNIRMEVADIHGNTSVLAFVVKNSNTNTSKSLEGGSCNLYSNKLNIIGIGKARIELPKSAIFCSVGIDTLRYVFNDTSLVDKLVYRFGTEYVPIDKPFLVCIKVDEPFSEKKYIVRKQHNGKFVYVGGDLIDGELRASSKFLGDFAVAIDTIPPVIDFISKYGNSGIKKYRVMKFAATDVGTGIVSYRAEINGEWVLCKYNVKKEELVCEFKQSQLKIGKENTFTITVNDACNNKSIFEKRFRL